MAAQATPALPEHRRLTLALLASLALHAALLARVASHGGWPDGAPPDAGAPAQQLKVSLQPAPPHAAALRTPPPGAAAGSPLLLAPIAAAYPEGALALGIAATVEVRALVDESGRVEQAEVVSASFADLFDRSALSAVRAARFVPATVDGRPAKSRYRAIIYFDLPG